MGMMERFLNEFLAEDRTVVSDDTLEVSDQEAENRIAEGKIQGKGKRVAPEGGADGMTLDRN
jgi:hypothetical protein